MSKRSLAEVVRSQSKKTPLDLAEETLDSPKPDPPQPAPAATTAIPRSTDRISISLLAEERIALEDKVSSLKHKGRRDLKISRLARIAFKMLLDAEDEDILRIADEVPNLEQLRVKNKKT